MTAGGCGSVRVTIASATRRVDLLLPDAVPVAELVPELARAVGLLDQATAPAGFRILTTAGQELHTEVGLAAQGVRDGGLLTLTTAADALPPADDDVAEVMAEVVERDQAPWHGDHARAAAWCTGVLGLALGAAGLLVQRDSVLAGWAAAAFAAAFTSGGVLASRAGRGPAAAVVLGALGAAYAGVAGIVLGAGTPGVAPSAGAAVLVAGLVCLGGSRAGRATALPAVVVGTALLATWPVGLGTGLDPAVVLSACLVLVVLAGTGFPAMALAVTGAATRHLGDAGESAVDRARIAADARLAHEILLGLVATVGGLLVLVAPVAVSLGVAGTFLGLLSCLATMLRTRRHRSGAQVLVGLVTGAAGLAGVAGAALLLHPAWRLPVALLCCLAGALLVASATRTRPSPTSPRLSRLADLAEGAAVLALLPLLTLAGGVLDTFGP